MGYSKAEIFGNAKLNHAQVRTIRARGAAGEHPKALAREYNVAPSTVRKILAWETYTMVPEEGPMAPSSRPAPTQAEIEASYARLQGLLPKGQLPASLSLEDALAKQALQEAAERSPGLAKLEAEASKLSRGDQVLDDLIGDKS